MTSIPVNHAKSVMMDFAAKTPGRTTAAGETGGFTDVFKGQTKENKAGQEVKGTQTEPDVRTRTQTKVVQSAKDRMKQKEVSKTKDTQKTADEMTDVLKDTGAEIIREIAKELNVSEEDVLRAMEELGLSMLDLFQPESLTMVVMQTMGETDPMALLTNEELGTALKTLNQFVQNVTDELQTALEITPEQMEELLAKAEKAVTEDVKADVSLQTETEGDQSQPQILVEDFTAEEESTKVKTENQNVKEVTDALTEETPETVTEDFRQVDKATEKETGEKGTTEGQNLFSQNAGQHTEAVNAAKSQEVPFMHAQTREIMDQILEGMKVQMKPEMTQLEMQLHPASLGNVTVHIASKEGAITAQFTAQNETVKAALESQMVQLKETFAEQGVKVEAIEVSVQANGFRQEYEGSRDHENTADSKKKSPRRINLNNPATEGEEALSEEEQLAVSMMEANGSTVDYTA